MSGPTPPRERLVPLDQLRGFALLGILIINIQAFSMPSVAVINPTSYGDLQGLNLIVWLVGHVFAEQKFLSIFCMLFGAGIVLQTERTSESGEPARTIHRRRMFALMAIGLCHAYLLWYGDILFFYGLTGLAMYPLSGCRPRTLFLTAFAALSFPTLLSLALGWTLPYWPVAEQEALRAEWRPDAAALAGEIAAYQGGWLAQMSARASEALYFQSVVFGLWGFWRIAGLVLIGMALTKLGVLTGARDRGFYVRLASAGLAMGYPMIIFGVWQNFRAEWSVEYSMLLGGLYNYWGSVAVALAYAALVILQSRSLRTKMPGLEAVGRTALSNYLLQSLICTSIFYGHGLGWFGQVSRGGQLVIIMAVWVFQVGLSRWWLMRFRQGPAEWLWRSLAYGRLQALGR